MEDHNIFRDAWYIGYVLVWYIYYISYNHYYTVQQYRDCVLVLVGRGWRIVLIFVVYQA